MAGIATERPIGNLRRKMPVCISRLARQRLSGVTLGKAVGGKRWKRWIGRALWLALAIVLALPGAAGAAPSQDKIFVIGNYPVEARAADAVAAKEKAIADGQQAAFRSLLKRLVPVTAYRRLDALRDTRAADLIEGFAVRSERNSSTEYIASYDFSFQPDGVRRLLEQAGIPFLDRQAEPVTLVPVYRAPGTGAGAQEPFSEARGSDAWLYAWKALDLANTITPLNLKPAKSGVRAEVINAMAGGDVAATRAFASEHQAGTIVLALLEPDPGNRRVRVTMAGQDSAGPFKLVRNYRLDGTDLTYTAELAAVISLAIIEGRWKVTNVRGGGGSYGGGGSGGATTASHGQGNALRIAVEFSGMGEWQVISRQLAQTPDVADLEVEGLSARGARVALKYPGGAERLADALTEHGLTLRSAGGGWVLSRR